MRRSLNQLQQLRYTQLSLFERGIGVEHVSPDDLSGKNKVCFAFYLFLQVAQDNAIFLLNRGGIGVAVAGTDLFVDVETCGTQDSALSRLPAY